jgi:hypothetical protein
MVLEFSFCLSELALRDQCFIVCYARIPVTVIYEFSVHTVLESVVSLGVSLMSLTVSGKGIPYHVEHIATLAIFKLFR